MAALAAVPIVLLLLRDDPSDLGLLPYGAPSDYVAPERSSNPIRTAFSALHVRTSGAFWLLFGSFFICGLSTNGLIQTHFISAAHDHNIDETTAAGLLALVGVFDVIGTIGSGWLTDRVDPRRLLFAYYALRGLSLMVLDPALDARNGGLWTFMVFYGLDWVAGSLRDATGSYRPAWIIAGIGCLIAAAGTPRIGADRSHDQVALAPA